MKVRNLVFILTIIAGISGVPYAWADVNIVIKVAPPAPRYERVPPPRHGYLWVRGFWRWEHDRYLWVPGRWIAERPGYGWIAERWVRRDNRWYFEPGRWERRQVHKERRHEERERARHHRDH